MDRTRSASGGSSRCLGPAAVLAAALALGGCAGGGSSPAGAGSDGKRLAGDPAPVVVDDSGRYAGPTLSAELETLESQPPAYVLVVEVSCPTGGYSLADAGMADRDGWREARLVLTAPSPKEMVTQAFVTHSVRLALGSQRTPVRVYVQQRTRGEDDADAPFRLAATATPH